MIAESSQHRFYCSAFFDIHRTAIGYVDKYSRFQQLSAVQMPGEKKKKKF